MQHRCRVDNTIIYRVSFPEHPAGPVRAGQRSRQPPDTGVHSGGIPQAFRGLELRRWGLRVTVMSRHDVVMILSRRVAARGGARLHAGRAAQLHVQDLLQAHHQQLPTTAGGHLHVCI